MVRSSGKVTRTQNVSSFLLKNEYYNSSNVPGGFIVEVSITAVELLWLNNIFAPVKRCYVGSSCFCLILRTYNFKEVWKKTERDFFFIVYDNETISSF